MTRTKIVERTLDAMAYLIGINADRPDECQDFPFMQPQIVFLGKARTPNYVTCALRNGIPEFGKQPVRTCKTAGCINGSHFRWGEPWEASTNQVRPPRHGHLNPAAKFTALEVAQLKSVDWGGGMYKHVICEIHGVALQTLHQVLLGKRWEHVAPYVNAAEWEARIAENNEDKGDTF